MSKKITILAEKPSQAEAYADSFEKKERNKGYYTVSGNGFDNAIITYGFGHLVELYNPEDYNDRWKKWEIDTLPMIPENYKFKVSKDKKAQYNIVKKHLDNADEIIVATDSDREGEAIARLIIRLSGNDNKSIKRLWINSLEVDEIQKGFQNLKEGKEFYSSFIEAETRQIADWLVGMNLSRLYTLCMQKSGMKGVFSIGRVQTPTLFLVYQRQMEIENFVKKPFFELYANFRSENGQYQGKYKDRFNTLEELEEFKSINSLADDTTATIKELTKEEKRNFAPKLFSLSDLQTEANKKYNFSANQTLEIAQSLYEKKITSYPRSDSNYIGTPEFNYLKDSLDNYLKLVNQTIEDKQLEENKRYVNSAKVQEHYAIIPTKTLPDLSKLKDDERKIYKLILFRTLAIFEKPYLYEETTIITDVNSVEFKTIGKIELDKGYKRLYEDNTENKDNKDEDDTLPNVYQGESVTSIFETKKGETQPPKYYTEGTLLTAMKNVGRTLDDEDNKDILKETEGIGTEATRASIIENLKSKDYITKGKNLMVTEKGLALCEVIKDDPISNAKMTATWEQYLKQINRKTGTQKAFLTSILNFIEHSIENVPNNFSSETMSEHVKKIAEENKIGTCPKCQSNIVDKGKFYGCSGYKDGCKFTLPKKWSSKTIPRTNIIQLIEKGETTEIKGFKSKKGNKFNAKLKLEDEKLQFVFDN